MSLDKEQYTKTPFTHPDTLKKGPLSLFQGTK